MPAPGIIERIAAQSMAGADSEEITKAVESIAAQSEEQAEVLRDLEERRQLEERAKRENMPIVYVLKEQFRKLDPAMIHEQEEKHHCVLIPADDYEIQRMKEEAVPYTMPPKLQKGTGTIRKSITGRTTTGFCRSYTTDSYEAA